MTPSAYRHEALLYDRPEELVSWVADFARDGLAKGEPVLVVLPSDRLSAVTDALGPDADAVEMLDMHRVGRNPARATGLWRQFTDRHPGRPLRGVGEPVYAERSAVELTECRHHELLLNAAVPPTARLWLVCPYERPVLDAATIESACATHPVVCEHGTARPSAAYRPSKPESVLGEPLPPPPADAVPLRFEADDLPAVRRTIRARAAAEGLPAGRVDEVVLAVHEATANALRHGCGQTTLGVWRDGDWLVCEVRDEGRLRDPLAGRIPAAELASGGRGLWLVNQLCDLVQLRSGSGGTRVRMWIDVDDRGGLVAA